VHHGDGIASWAVNQRAIHRGHGIRTGSRPVAAVVDPPSPDLIIRPRHQVSHMCLDSTRAI
jgi:hypothetical protein